MDTLVTRPSPLPGLSVYSHQLPDILYSVLMNLAVQQNHIKKGSARGVERCGQRQTAPFVPDVREYI